MDSTATVLFGKTRQAVLVLLYESPDRAYYLREIVRQTGISSGALQKELLQLCQADLLLRTQDGNRVTYQANTTHPIFTELQAIVRKTCGIPAQIKSVLADLHEHIAIALLYGSMAKGTDHAGSDVDLLIVGTLSLQDALAAISPIEQKIGREISVRIYNPEEFRQRRAEGDGFLLGVLSGPYNLLMGALSDA